MVAVIGGGTKRYMRTHRIEMMKKARISFMIQPRIRAGNDRLRRLLYWGIVERFAINPA
jgi:hypothetical protein